jgi:ribosome-binding protein aMBF1 (putative translation factor)
MDHQDWKPVVLKKSTKNKIVPVSSTQMAKSVKTDKVTDEVIQQKKITPTMAREVQNARVSKKMSQVELAKKTNLQLSVIQDIEKGNGLYVASQFNKICKILGVHIHRH